MKSIVFDARIEERIYIVRGHRIMLDRDLAKIYGVSTGRLNEQVKRNRARFPDDFMFRLTQGETENWISQFATSNSSTKMGLRKPPYAFTEHGAVMLAAVLKSDTAVAASIQVVRAFNRLRRMALAHKDLAFTLTELARRVKGHDEQFKAVFDALQKLTDPPVKTRRRIGFTP